MNIQPHHQRVIDEKTELDIKLEKLLGFIGTKVFCGLDEAEQKRMHRQYDAMFTYSRVLGERIEAFTQEATL